MKATKEQNKFDEDRIGRVDIWYLTMFWGMILAIVYIGTIIMLPPAVVETVGNCTESIPCTGYLGYSWVPSYCIYCNVGIMDGKRPIKVYLVYVGSDVMDMDYEGEFDPNTLFKRKVWIVVGSVMLLLSVGFWILLTREIRENSL